MSSRTPMMQQYEEIKKQHQDAILLFRLGDFYEMFGTDAELISRELELVLTSREAGAAGKIPMCGFPYHSADSYISRLVERGYRVAICEQIEDPKQCKGLVKREVTRIITPGTILDGQALPEKQSNYLVALVPKLEKASRKHLNSRIDYNLNNTNDSINIESKEQLESTSISGVGLAVVEASTGEFLVTEFWGEKTWDNLKDEIARLKPAEILVGTESLIPLAHDLIMNLHPATITKFSDLAKLDFREAERILTRHFNTTSLEGFGCGEMSEGIVAACGLLKFLQETQKAVPEHIKQIKPYFSEEFVVLDQFTRRNLEITSSIQRHNRQGTLIEVLDHTVTAMGGRMLRNWLERPLLQISVINKRLDSIDYLVNDYFLRTRLYQLLDPIYDLERLVGRITYGTANARDLIALKDSLALVAPIREVLLNSGINLHTGINNKRSEEAEKIGKAKNSEITDTGNRLTELLHSLDPLEDVVEYIQKALVDDPPTSIREGGIIRTGYHSEVDRLREAAGGGKQWITCLESRERERTGIKSLKVGYNKVFGYYIEVTKPNLPQVPADYVRKQTLANSERFITPELKEYESLVLGAEDQLTALEYQLFVEIRESVKQTITRIQQTARALAELDVLVSLAEVAIANHYSKPQINSSSKLVIKGARHPVVEKNLGSQVFVPNDVWLDTEDKSIKIITGPNMGGKSTYCRSVALICLMAQIGSFVPASEAQIGLVDRIFARVGASDDLGSGKSTFMVEMNEVGNIVNTATSRSLVILDEVGRGTSTYDGLSIAWALTEYIHNYIKARTLFATHYHELTELENILPRVKNYNVAVREQGEKIVFLHQVLPGGVDRSYGIQVARLAGLPDELIKRAQEILQQLEQQKNSSTFRAYTGLQNTVNLSSRQDFSSGNQKKTIISSVKESTKDIQPQMNSRQMHYFKEDTIPIIEEILNMNLLNLTPLEAMNRLYEIQQKLLLIFPRKGN